MAIDFFAAQDAAKKRTALAVFLFALGVVGTAVLLYATLSLVLYSSSDRSALETLILVARRYPEFLFWTLGGTATVILAASLFKILSLNEGGLRIAESVGARPIAPNTLDEAERRLLHVVEEMSLASGYPIPQVGILDDEEGINAFAAALGPRDAVIVVTRGALDALTRDELQAVVGHEFSHLLNGDSHLNIRLAGWVFGLFFVTIIGRWIIEGDAHSNSRKKGGGILLGFLIFLVGLVGWLFGRIIQALISRQREYLADASSVQFTRNPDSMVAALGKLRSGSQIRHHQASGLAHFFFAPSNLSSDWTGLLSTHPPLEARMRAIDQNYEQILADLPAPAPAAPTPNPWTSALAEAAGSDTPAEKPSSPPSQSQALPQAPAPASSSAAAFTQPQTLVALVAATGSITRDSLATAAARRDNLPAPLQAALATPLGAQALLLGLAFGREDRANHLLALQDKLPTPLFRTLHELDAALEQVSPQERLLLAQLAASRTRNLPATDKEALAAGLEAIIALDGKLTAFEALYVELVRHWLQLQPDKHPLPPSEAASRVLSFLWASQNDATAPTPDDFQKLLADLALPSDKIRPIKYVSTATLREALPSLSGFSFLQRRELLIAAGRVLKLDSLLTDDETELFRALAMLMDCPVPTRI